MESPAPRKNQNRPLKWLDLASTEPYYLLHLLSFFSYFAARPSSDRLLQLEIQAILLFLALTVVKLVKEETWEGFIADTLFYAKGFLFVMALVIDYRLALCYVVGFLVIHVLTRQPASDGLGNFSHMTPLQLETLLTEGNTSRFWLVEFRASYSSKCIRTSSFIPELSITYSNKNLSFGIVDLGRFSNVAEYFGISLPSQLPTYILFDNAVEVGRFPVISFDARSSSPTITKSILCRYFELDRRLIEYVSGK
ncbi:hypothetical protein QJS04_geneDACA002673 [Acorus gramineus]|uniref:Thioredoxin-related transmembrane protein 2 n=1 Tax=Acorus gramineus TaxID=55184 RepID=A0AAV9ASE5_ACOGR|nr:hypothetical protein QJS04_geneDACA002673 [Acorus gramineus]